MIFDVTVDQFLKLKVGNYAVFYEEFEDRVVLYMPKDALVMRATYFRPDFNVPPMEEDDEREVIDYTAQYNLWKQETLADATRVLKASAYEVKFSLNPSREE